MIGIQHQRSVYFVCYILVAVTYLACFTDEALPNKISRYVGHELSNPLVGEDGKIYVCSEKVAFAFEINGTISWAMILNYTCNPDISPALGDSGTIYLVAENRILKLWPSNISLNEPAFQLFVGPETAADEWGEVVGISVSIWSLTLFITVKNIGLFAFSLHGKLLWNSTPVLDRSDYQQGCKGNAADCFFATSPVVDYCNGNVHVVNSEGQLYSMSVQKPDFNWVQDFSGVDKVFSVVAGNNDRLYLIFPLRSIVMGLNATSGSVIWQQSVGPLSSLQNVPVVDVAGQVLIGSLDGFVYVFSPSGDMKKYINGGESKLVQVSPFLDCSGTAIYVSQTRVEAKISHVYGESTYISATKSLDVEITLLSTSTGSSRWRSSFQGQHSSLLFDSDLRDFTIDERVLLAFVAASNFGKHSRCSNISNRLDWSCSQSKPKIRTIYIGNGRAILFFSIFQFVVLVALAWIVRFCYIFWSKKKLKKHDLRMFFEKRRSLHRRKKVFKKMIAELEKKVADDINAAASDDIMAKIGDMVKEKEGIERKLSTTYSLGGDSTTRSARDEQLLPLYNSKGRSRSFQSSTRESITLFHTVSSDSSPSSESSSWTSWSGGEEETVSASDDDDDVKGKGKGKGGLVRGGSDSPSTAIGGSLSMKHGKALFDRRRGGVKVGGSSEIEEVRDEGLEKKR